MSDVAIRVENLCKMYRIGGKQEKYRTLRDALSNAATAPFRRIGSAFHRNVSNDNSNNTIWALKDVSFEVKRGEVVGVIGRNGAGKSTLLKTLSRITEPTSGYAEIYGRVGSLLEVGTGFHPELTGRENIFLNGAILGMKQTEIEDKFDEIVDFAEVERFIDTPVKHYSSGMYLRLAFAVAAHLEPEILLVDEVLAVGDAQFQKKCLGKMGDVANEGRTVLFVSHNMGAIRNLCNSGVFLHGGEVHQRGGIADSVEAYYRSIGLLQSQDNMLTSNAPGTVFGPVRVNGSLTNIVGNSDAFELSTTLAVTQQVNGFSIFCILEDMNGHTLFHVRDESNILGMSHVPIGQYGITLAVPALPLNPGLYSVYFKVIFWGGRASARHLSDKFPLDVVGTSSLTDAVLHPRTTWHIEMEHGESICE